MEQLKRIKICAHVFQGHKDLFFSEEQVYNILGASNASDEELKEFNRYCEKRHEELAMQPVLTKKQDSKE